MAWFWGIGARRGVRERAGSERLDAAPRLAQTVGETPVFDIGRRRWGMVEIVGNRLQRRRSDQGDGWMRGAYLGPKRRIELVPHQPDRAIAQKGIVAHEVDRSEEHTSERQSLMRISYAV